VTALTSAAGRASRRRTERWSTAAVVALTTAAILAGLVLRSTVQDGTRRIEAAGRTYDIPARWVVSEPVGDAILSAYDPLDPDQRYVVERYAPGQAALDQAARQRVTDRTTLLSAFTLVDETPAKVGAVDTERLRYTFADSGAAPPVVVEAVDDHFVQGDHVVAVRLEAPQTVFAAAVERYDRFRQQVVDSLSRAARVDPRPVAAVAARFGVAVAAGPMAARPIAAQPAIVAAGPADLIAATVEVQQLSVAGDPTSVVGWGSGTIIGADGLILTNAHVAKPSAAGLAIYDQDPTPVRDPAGLVVAVVEAEDRPPVQRYRASVVAADGYLDAALIKIDRNLDGSPISSGTLRLPTVQVGDSDALRVGDGLTVIGFPGIGGDTISLSSGEVSGFLGDDRIGTRAWIKTDAVVSHGNSGGLAADTNGRIVGIPTRGREDVGGYSLVRPIGLVRPLILAAIGGHPTLNSQYVVPGTGTERVTFQTWTDTVDACVPGAKLTEYPQASRQILALFGFTSMVPGEDVITQWRLDDKVVLRGGLRLGSNAASGGCLTFSLYLDRGLPDGRYRLELFVGPSLKAAASAETVVGPRTSESSVSLTGRIVDVDSGQPIGGAVIYLLSPGTDAEAWYGAPSEDQVVAQAVAGNDGQFRVDGLASGTVYPVVVVADGYYPTGGTIGPLNAGASSLAGDISLARIGP
jgi:S1-C subfamily serine protease